MVRYRKDWVADLILTYTLIKVENWDILGEKTKQAIDQAERQAARREQQRPSISMADPYEAESSTEDSIWVSWTLNRSLVTT